MNLCFIFSGEYDGFKSVLKCAEKNACCPITVISNPDKFPIWNSTVEKLRKVTSLWSALTIARWFVLRELVSGGKLSLPVFCSDWDVMIFQNLKQAYAPFLGFDFCASNYLGAMSAAYGVNKIAPLDAHCEFVDRTADAGGDAAKGMQDMMSWTAVAAMGFSCGNLFEIKNNSVFDHNIVCGEDRFVMKSGVKSIRWIGGRPHFVSLDRNRAIKANTIHCWGPFKNMPDKLLKMSK